MTLPFKGCSFQAYPKGSVTQFYGENPSLYANTCASPSNCLRGHNGIDLVAPWGTPIVAVEAGKVVEVKDQATGYGKHVRVISDTYEWTYGHLSSIDAKLGEHIEAGSPIGKMGNTGFVVSGATPFWKSNPYAGTHLHLNCRLFKPYSGSGSWTVSYSTGDKGDILDYNNGYFGGIDSLPLFVPETSFGEPFDQAIKDSPVENRLTIISILNQIKALYGKL